MESAKPLNVKKLFGEVPRLSDELKRKSNRLSDQVELLKEKGYEDGYNAGYENGLTVGTIEGKKAGLILGQNQSEAERRIEAQQFMEEWEQLRLDFETAVEKWFDNAEQVVTDMAMECVRRILHTELQTNRESSLEITKDVFKFITHAKTARVMINPNDFALFESHREALEHVSNNLRAIDFIPDPSVTAGVMIETDAGVIDATIETKLKLIDNEFRNAA
jgi:flagellar biosynthesis/type III secretory pathway protein FliH